jgi:hypothetical protein
MAFIRGSYRRRQTYVTAGDSAALPFGGAFATMLLHDLFCGCHVAGHHEGG